MGTFAAQSGTVVVGCDGSRKSRHAVAAATREAARRGAELVLLAAARHRPYWPEDLDWVARAEAGSKESAQAAG